MKHLKSFENLKYKGIEEDEFIKLFKENCKNFSFDNDPLYRGDEEIFDFGLHEPIERNTRGITFVDFFIQKEKDTEKYPVVRKESAIGIGGGDVGEMKKSCAILGSSDFNGFSPVYRVIPFDNSKIVFCSAVDLQTLDYLKKIKTVNDEDFIMVEYTKNFKVPVEELKEIQKRLLGTTKYANKGFEFFMSSPALLINVKKENYLKTI